MDFYELLGVLARRGHDDIKRAYRRLARRYHPDINPGDRAADELFRQIVADAFEVLTRSRAPPAVRPRRAGGPRPARAAHLRVRGLRLLGDVGERRGGLHVRRVCSPTSFTRRRARDARAPSRGADLHASVRVSFADAVRGGAIWNWGAPSRAVRGMRRVGPRARRRGDLSGVPGRGHDPIGARSHGVRASPAGAARVQGGCVRPAVRQVHRHRGRRPAADAIHALRARRASRMARACAVPGGGHAGVRGGEPGDLYVTVAGRAAPVVPPRRATTCT